MTSVRSPSSRLANTASEAPRASSVHRLARGLSAAVALSGCLVLAGWLLDSPVLKSLIPGLVAMNPITAAAFVLAALSLWWSAAEPGGLLGPGWRCRAAFAAAALVALIGALTLFGYLTGTNLGADQLLFRSKLAGNRIAPNTALDFLLAGTALMLLDVETRGGLLPAQFLALSTAAVSLLVLTGYAYGAHTLYGVASYIPMALNTALAFALLSAGILAARLDRGITAVIVGDNVGSAVARRLLPAVVVVPFLLGMATVAGQGGRLYDAPFGVALLVVLSITTLTALIWWHASALRRVDLARGAAEELVRDSQREAERASRAKSEFLSRMSHELRTPLNAILGFAQLLEMESLSPQQRESVGHILKGGRHLLQLINEVLDIARIEAGRLAISPEPVPLPDVVQETLDLMRPLAGGMNVRLAGDAAGTRTRCVLADSQRLKQVLLNLVSNAIKYGGRGGAVTLSCEDVPGGRVRIKVSDTGPGIPPDRMERLFIPFERLGGEQTGVEGTGLGLALSKGLVGAMGGTIGVDSAVGRGSTFWVEFAAAESPLERLGPRGQEEPSTVLPVTALRAGTVLYIEDNLSNFELIRHLLTQRPRVKLLAAMQGRLGLELARQHRPDMILLDLHLPDIPGDEILRRLQRSSETRHIPVVMISADATAGQANRLLAAGARAFLTKPLDVKKFLALLDGLLGESEVRRAREQHESGIADVR